MVEKEQTVLNLQEQNSQITKQVEEYKNEIEELKKELKKKIPEYINIKNFQSAKNLPYITIEQKFGKK